MIARESIDTMSYEDMLRLYRFEPIGSKLFTSDIGAYFMDRFDYLRDTVSLQERVAASKNVGWAT